VRAAVKGPVLPIQVTSDLAGAVACGGLPHHTVSLYTKSPAVVAAALDACHSDALFVNCTPLTPRPRRLSAVSPSSAGTTAATWVRRLLAPLMGRQRDDRQAGWGYSNLPHQTENSTYQHQVADEMRALNFMGFGCPELHERRLLSIFTAARMQTYF